MEAQTKPAPPQTPPARPVFCTSCQHMRPAHIPMCAANEARIIDVVHGYKLAFCQDARADRQPCGPTGKLFTKQFANVAAGAA